MANIIRFPLKMNGADVRTIEELREHFDLESVLGYFANGKLATWLRNRYYDNEASAVEALSADDEKLARKLCSILNVPYEEESTDIDIAFIKRRQEKIAILSQTTNDESLISKVDAIALDQEDLLDILDTGTEKMIYLFKGKFDIPLTVKDITYVGLENPVVTLRAYDNVDFNSLNLKFVDINYTWNNSNLTSADEQYQAESLYELGKIDEAKKILKKITGTPNPRVSNSKIVESELKKAEELFSVWECEKLLPIVEDLVKYGSPKGKYIMGWLYYTGFDRIIFPKNHDKAMLLFIESYKDGYLPAGFRFFLIKDDIVAETLLVLKELADSGDSFAAYEYANICSTDCYHSLYKDYKSAFDYYQKSPLFLKYYEIANMYKYGIGINKNLSIALDYYKKSAEYGYSPSEFNVASLYCEGKGWLGSENPQECFKWMNRTYNHGHTANTVLYPLALYYRYGFGTPIDYNKAFQLYKEGMKIGDGQLTANLGWCYEHGKGTSVDMSLAKKYYRMGADIGDSYCMEQCKRLGC